jgi:sugar O-acyltransferase (sialic acid O-acetyltransferase NeuD family)
VKPLIIFGASGHARVIMDAARRSGQFDLIGVLDRDRPTGDSVDGAPVLGTDECLAEVVAAYRGVVGIIGIGEAGSRQAIANVARARVPDFLFTAVIHPSAILAPDVAVGPGTFIAAGVCVNTGSRIGIHAVLNTHCTADHDCLIEDFAFIGPGVSLAGTVRVHRGAFIGAGASIVPNVTIGAGAIVGAGAAVLDDVEPGMTVVGVPARPVRAAH